MKQFVCIMVVLAVAAGGVAMAASNDTVTLDSGKLKLVFGTKDGAMTLTSLADSAGLEWLSGSGEQRSLWLIALRGPDGATQEIRSPAADFTGVSGTSRGAALSWSAAVGSGRASVAVRIRLPRGSSLSYWSLQVDLPEGWQVVRADFPVMPNVGVKDGLKLAVPTGWGLEYDVTPALQWSGTYPSLVSAMQFVTFYGGGTGLYIGMHDPEANHKHLAVKGSAEGPGFTCTNWPAIAKTPEKVYRVPYEAVIGVFDGDYWNAAQIYREFTLKTPWGKAGPVSRRPIPKWLTDTELWLMPDAKPLDNVEPCKKAAEFFGVPISLHWYNWHQIPFDTLYPEYFPTLPHFKQGVKALQVAGFHAMPYINGRLCDPKSKTWTDEGGSKSAALQENNEPYTEVYGSEVPLNVMCPYTAQWQEKIAGLAGRLTNEYGVDGVYIDQICAAGANRCFDASHGHPVGGGHFWADGYRKLLDLARSKLPKDRILTTEENAECWMDQFDALLLVNTPNWGRVIPLFPAVYSGRTIPFGFQYFTGDDLARSLPFRFKMARAFTYGSQMGWINVGRISAPEAAKEAEFLRNLARCRRFGHKYLVYGRFLGLLDVGGSNPTLSGEGSNSFGGGSYSIDTPAVIASAWQAEDGSLGVALANMSDEPRSVEMSLPVKAAGLRSSGLVVSCHGPEGETEAGASPSARQKLTVPARSGLVVSAAGK